MLGLLPFPCEPYLLLFPWATSDSLQFVIQRGSFVSTLLKTPQNGHWLSTLNPSFRLQLAHQYMLQALQCFQFAPDVLHFGHAAMTCASLPRGRIQEVDGNRGSARPGPKPNLACQPNQPLLIPSSVLCQENGRFANRIPVQT